MARSREGLHLDCMRPSIIPPCKYLHKEMSLLPLAKTREAICGTCFFNTIYSYGQRRRDRERERGSGQQRQTSGEKEKGQRGTQRENKWWEGRPWEMKELHGRKQKKHQSNPWCHEPVWVWLSSDWHTQMLLTKRSRTRHFYMKQRGKSMSIVLLYNGEEV